MTVQNRWLAAGGSIVGLLALFQVFGRYSYTYYDGVVIDRVDRLTGISCRMPCLPVTPAPSPVETATPSAELEDLRAIELVRNRPDALKLVSQESSDGDAGKYRWAVLGRYGNDGAGKYPDSTSKPSKSWGSRRRPTRRRPLTLCA